MWLTILFGITSVLLLIGNIVLIYHIYCLKEELNQVDKQRYKEIKHKECLSAFMSEM